MAKPLSELRKKISPEVQQQARAQAVEILTAMSLAEVRKSRSFSQKILAAIMGIAQKNVSELERRSDFHISTLGSYINAMGGTLEVHAKFPDGQDVKIDLKRAEARS